MKGTAFYSMHACRTALAGETVTKDMQGSSLSGNYTEHDAVTVSVLYPDYAPLKQLCYFNTLSYQ